jgi:NAD(P)-dependent dehydrogenase (short-subunit alcohol dehydrogenase family)
VINGVQTFLSRIIERGEGGHIVNTASGAGLAPTGAGVLYTTPKYGVVGMSEALNGELAPAGIGVSVLCPGPVATGIVRRSAGSQPRSDETPTKAQEAMVSERLERSSRWLQRDGVSIDEVGEMVLKAVRGNALYIHTDRLVEPLIKARTQALIDAMPN